MGVVNYFLGSVRSLDNLSRKEKVRRLEKASISMSIKKYIYIYIYKIEGTVDGLTRARTLFKLRNTSYFLINLRSVMSSSSSKACSTALATYPAFLCWKSLMEASTGRVALSNAIIGVQTGTPTWESSLLSTTVYVTLAYLAPFWGSTSLEEWVFPPSTTFLPLWSLLSEGRWDWVGGLWLMKG